MNTKQGQNAELLYDMRQERRRIADANNPIWWVYSFLLGLLACGAGAALLYFIFGG